MKRANAMAGRLAMMVAAGVLSAAHQGCVTDQGVSSTPVGPWQRDIRGLAAHLQASEAFWKEPDVEEPVDWTAKVWDVSSQKVKGKPDEICVWLEVPYTKDQTRAGLWPVPVQVIIPSDSALGSEMQKLKLQKGQLVHVKGTFKGFVHTGMDYSQGGKVTAFGQANDMASVMAMLSKVVEDNPLEKAAKAYAEAKRLPLGTTPQRRLILPNMEVKPDELAPVN